MLVERVERERNERPLARLVVRKRVAYSGWGAAPSYGCGDAGNAR